MTKTEIKNLILSPTIEGLEALRAHRLAIKTNMAILREIEKSCEDILKAQKCLSDIKTAYEQS